VDTPGSAGLDETMLPSRCIGAVHSERWGQVVEHEPRRVLLVTHTGANWRCEVAREATPAAAGAGMQVRLLGVEDEALKLDPVEVGRRPRRRRRNDVELIMVLGGDGSILRWRRAGPPARTPVPGREPRSTSGSWPRPRFDDLSGSSRWSSTAATRSRSG
jgi:hypothetical protein